MINDTSGNNNCEKHFPVGVDDKRASVQVCEDVRGVLVSTLDLVGTLLCAERLITS